MLHNTHPTAFSTSKECHLTWRQATLFPDPQLGWQWTDAPLAGLPALVRLLLALQRAGIQQVIFAAGSNCLKPWLTAYARQKPLPELVWPEPEGPPEFTQDGPLLALRWGALCTPKVLRWFRQSLGEAPCGKAGLPADGSLPLMVSCSGLEAAACCGRGGSFAELSAAVDSSLLVIPPDLFCRPVEELARPEGDRGLLEMVGKPTDRWHVVWVRSWSFPVLRWLARRQATPNQVTILGFVVALLACLLMAQGGYWSGVIGAVMLYGSWVLDCMDGTLARLTFAESAFGQKLDTVLGHVSNLGIFGALVWAVYGQESWWKTGAIALFLLGGIMVAYRVTQMEKQLRPADTGTTQHKRLQGILDKINHRDYAVVIFVLALLNGFKVFLWLSLAGVQVFWLIHLWLITKHRQASQSR
jgi:phosphatidylglycerophosphate synthase